MKRISEKIISITIISSLFLSLGFNIFFFRPKTAQALDAGAGWTGNIKEYVLDAVGWVVSDVMLKRLEKNIQEWGMGRKSSIQLPFGVEDFKDYFDEFLNIASAKFLDEFKNTPLCTGINIALGNAPQINLRTLRSNLRSVGRFSRTFSTYYVDQPAYRQANACTLQKVINNVEAFIKRPRITLFGWDAWKALNSPANNIYGAFFSALDRKTQIAAREVMNASRQVTAGGGYRNQTATTANSRDKCSQDCQTGTNLPACMVSATQTTTDYLLQSCLDGAELDYESCLALGGHTVLDPVEPCISERTADIANCNNNPTTVAGHIDLTLPGCQVQIQSCVNNCTRIPFVPLATAVTNLGSHIQTAVNKSLSGDMEKLLGTDEITELVGIFFSAILNKAMTGLGLAFKSSRATASQQSRAQNQDRFAYQKQFQKNTLRTEKKDVRSSLYSTMEQSIRQFSRSIISCKDDEMMTYQDYGKNLADILEANVEAMYVGMQGVNLQPDAVVLDPPYAPYPVYGYSWGEIFSSKVPEKCRIVLNQLNMASNTNCSDIISGLEPNYQMTIPPSTPSPQCNDNIDNDNDGNIDYPNDTGCYSLLDNNETSISGGGGDGREEPETKVPQVLDLVPGIGDVPCLPCLYDHDSLNCPRGPVPPQRYPGEGNTVWTSAVLNQKLTFYQGCAEWYVIALNRCDECLKKYDESCSKLATAAERNNCIMQNCDNYQDFSEHVIDPPENALDFYGKCLIEEQKDSCFTCLKEYYIPATYCEQTRDYAARLVTKYPTVVVNKHAKNEGEFRGLFDQSIADMGGLCEDNDHAEDITLALICRALPDFAYGGAKACQTQCNDAGMTAQQLQDVTDFRPDNRDCWDEIRNRTIKLPVGGQEPFKTIDDGILEARGRCCGDFWQKDRKNYTICVGAGPSTETTGPGTITALRASLSANPVSGPAPLNNVDLTATVTGVPTGQDITYNFDCDNDGTFEYSATNNQTTVTATDYCNYPENNTIYTASVYIMLPNLGNSVTTTTSIQTTDCGIATTISPTTGILPASVSITGSLNNSEPGPFTYRFYCNVPPMGGPINTWGDASSIEYTENSNPFTWPNSCSFDTPGTKAVGVYIQAGATTTSCYQTISIQEPPDISCNAEIEGSPVINPGDPVTILVTPLPNSSYLSLIHGVNGTILTYTCGGSETMQTIPNTSSLDNYRRNLFCNFDPNSSEGLITVRIQGTNPADGSVVSGTCYANVTVMSPF
jgi:hypothetical protein